MKIKAKTKGIIKKVSLALAGIIAISAIGVGVAKIVEYTKEDLKTISPSFSVGNLGSDGKYVNDESTLYTKEAFQCDGLQIKLDFDNEIEYQIYFYDDLDNFVESTEVLSSAYSETVHDGYARIVIMPTNDEDGKIGLTERITYPDQMTIKVAKEQNIEYYQLYNKRMYSVDTVSSLVFVHGDFTMTDGNGHFSSSKGVITSNLLNVGTYSGYNFDCQLDNSTGLYVAAYGFNLLGDEIFYTGSFSLSEGEKIPSDTTHIFIKAGYNGDVAFADDDVELLKSSITFLH